MKLTKTAKILGVLVCGSYLALGALNAKAADDSSAPASNSAVVSADAGVNTSDLHEKFKSFGGSDEAFSKILKAVAVTKEKAQQLQDKIDRVYNQQLSRIMGAKVFVASSYRSVYTQLEREKLNLVKDSLAAMVDLLQSMSEADRKAYTKLLFVNSKISGTSDAEESLPKQNNAVTVKKSTTTETTTVAPVVDTNNTASSAPDDNAKTTTNDSSATSYNE